MRPLLFSTALLVAGILLLSSCNNGKDKTTSGTTKEVTTQNDSATIQQPVKKEEPANTNSNQQNYGYGPEVSVISGTLTTEIFFGPPGYGEHPDTDKKEEAYLVVLEKPINIIGKSKNKDEDTDEPTVNAISKIQLIWPDETDRSTMKNKKVKLTGTFFAAHTGHHRTDALLEVQEVAAQ